MDILAARKKAAERAQAQVTPEPSQPSEAPQAPPHELPLPADPEPTQPQVDAETPTREGDAPVTAEPAAMAPAAGPGETQAREMELVSFLLGGEEYAVMVQDVREVLKLAQMTPVPNAPDYILGVMSLRGRMTPIMDLCKRFGLTSGVRDEKSRIIVVNADEEDVGLLVDRVTGVLRIMPDAIKPAPENIEQGKEYLRGIARKDDKLYILLDLEKAVAV